MKIYSIYTSNKEEEEPIIIPQERSYIAGIFNILWALYHRMWFVAGVTLIADIALNIAIAYIDSKSFFYVAEASLVIIYILFASDLREYSAKRMGYKLSDIIVASDEAEAEMKFYNRLEDWSSFKGDDDDNGDNDSGHGNNKHENQLFGTKIAKTVNPW